MTAVMRMSNASRSPSRASRTSSVFVTDPSPLLAITGAGRRSPVLAGTTAKRFNRRAKGRPAAAARTERRRAFYASARTELSSTSRAVLDLPADHGHQDAYVTQRLYGHGARVIAQDDQIRELSGTDRPLAVLFDGRVGAGRGS